MTMGRPGAALLLLAAALWHGTREGEACREPRTEAHDLGKVYGEFNSEYFGGRLPKDAVLDWGEHGDDMASTMFALFTHKDMAPAWYSTGSACGPTKMSFIMTC